MERDTYGWTLTYWRKGINPKTKEPTRNPTKSYHGTLAQALLYALDKNVGEAQNLQELQELLTVKTEEVIMAANRRQRRVEIADA